MTTLWSDRVNELDERWREDGFKNYRKDVRDKIIQLLPEGEKVLDVGCGTAMLYEHLPQELKPSYVGVDFTPEFIEYCFHLVNSTTLLQHIPEWRKAAEELARVSKKYVVSTCRSHLKKTRIISTTPVLRRQFNPQDIIDIYNQYGDVSWQWGDGIVIEKPVMGIYILEKQL